MEDDLGFAMGAKAITGVRGNAAAFRNGNDPV